MSAICPAQPGLVPAVSAPEFVLETPDHMHVRVSPLEFCFRLHAAKGWTFAGGFTDGGPPRVVSEATFRASFATAREAMVGRLAGWEPDAAPVPCPECGQLFYAPYHGKGPWRWDCGPEHTVVSADGWRVHFDGSVKTLYPPGTW
jgi:hypothetical protein